MPTTTLCPHCDVVLNIPEEGIGRRLKCPQCGGKFHAGRAESRPPSQARGVADAGEASTASHPAVPTRDDEDLVPLAPIDLRETFDLPLLRDDAPSPAPSRPKSGATADAEALFRDDEPIARRHSVAEARMRTRRCESCGGSLPPGMTLCQACGLDQETGERIDLNDEDEEEFDEILAPSFAPQLPTGLLVVGSLALIASAVLAVLAFVGWVTAAADHQKIGAPMLLAVCVFGVVAAVQLLRGRSARLLIVALALGAIVDVAVLIALPVWLANQATPDAREANLAPGEEPPPIEIDDETGLPKLPSYHERFDFKSLGLGVGVLGVEAAMFLYLMSPGVRRRFERG